MPLEPQEIVKIISSIFPFYKRDPQQLAKILSYAEIFEFSAGNVIYEQKGEAEALFILLEGSVQLNRRQKDTQKAVAVLDTGDFFGYEMLELNGVYHTSAVAKNDVDVLIFNRDQLVQLMESIPDLSLAFQTMYNSFKLARKTYLDWIQPEEVIYSISRRHPIHLFERLIAPFVVGSLTLPFLIAWLLVNPTNLFIPEILLGALGIILVAWILWLAVDWGNDYSVVTNQRVVFQEMVVLLYNSRQEAPMGAILAVTVDTNQLGRILSYGDVTIRTYAGIIKLPKLSNPDQVAALINAEIYRTAQLRQHSEHRAMTAVLRQKLGLSQADLQANSQKKVEPIVQPGALPTLLSNLFRMRFESGRTITYRTHWLFLFLKTILPVLTEITLVILFFLGLFSVIPILANPAILIVVLLLLFITFFWWLYQYMDWSNDFYVISEDQILDVYKKPLGREERRVAPIKNIQSVRFERLGIFGLIFNFGTVYIRVGETELTFDQVFDPSEVQRELLKRIAEIAYKEKQSAMASQKELVVDYLTIYHQLLKEEQRKNMSSGLDQKSE
jgi:hypothetical protein